MAFVEMKPPTWDESAMMKQILGTHAPDGREFALRPLLHVLENIFQHTVAVVTSPAQHQPQRGHQSQLDAVEEKALQNDFSGVHKLLPLTISKIACEISCKRSGGGDVYATTLSIFKQLSSYSWDAKVVLALAAFAVNYGEFWLVAELHLTNPLAKAIALLKQLPDFVERADAFKPKFVELSNLIKAMTDVAKCIVEFKKLPSQYISLDTPVMLTATADIPNAVYFTIRSIVVCSSQMMGLIGMDDEHTAANVYAWELSSLAHRISSIHCHLTKLLSLCKEHIEANRSSEEYERLRKLFLTPHTDNMKILTALIYAKDDQQPLYDGSVRQKVSLNALRETTVLLLISDLELPNEELSVLQETYSDAKKSRGDVESQFEIVWIPVVDQSVTWDQEKQKQFDHLQSQMRWYSLAHPSLLTAAVIRYIKEVWHFGKKPLAVVLDPQAKVVNNNAIPMIRIWGKHAYPFDSKTEADKWKKQSWGMDLLAYSIKPTFLSWIKDGKHICLYGGENLEWIRKFAREAQKVAQAAKIQLEMLYVGKSNSPKIVGRNIEIIKKENLGHALEDINQIGIFWGRLECMWQSKTKYKKAEDNNDLMLQEITTMLSFDGSDQGWAVITNGSDMAKAKGETIMNSLTEHKLWIDHVEEKGFIRALNDHIHGLQTPHHCNRVILPSLTGSIPERVICADCGRSMEKFIMYKCTND